jgi:hypothetical protein
MHVNAVTQPVVYIPSQVIAPSVPNQHPISLPTTDRSADPTPNGTPFVSAQADKDAAAGHGRGAALAKAPAAESLTARAAAEGPRIQAADAGVERAQPVRRGFDEYA